MSRHIEMMQALMPEGPHGNDQVHHRSLGAAGIDEGIPWRTWINVGSLFSFADFQVIYGHKVKSDPFYMATYDSFISAYLNECQ
jgi:hypothetical protein